MLETIQKVTKALAAAVTAGAGAYSAAQVAGNVGLTEWVTVVAVAVGAGLTVYFARNK